MRIKYKLWRTNRNYFAIVSNATKNIGDLSVDKYCNINKINSEFDIEKYKKNLKLEASIGLFTNDKIDFNGFEEIVGYLNIENFVKKYTYVNIKDYPEIQRKDILRLCKSTLEYYIFSEAQQFMKEKVKKWDIDVEFTNKGIIKIIKVY